MAITFVSSAVGRVVVPSAFTTLNVRSPASGLSAGGILALIGEADAGPSTSASGEDIVNNFFTSDQLGDVISKYSSGNLVDAFRAAVSASNDGNIVGSPTRIYLYKTNNSTSATASIPFLSDGAYGTFKSRLAGPSGNLLSWDTDSTTNAVEPTTGALTFIGSAFTYDLSYRQHGKAAVTYTVPVSVTTPFITSNTSSLQTNSFMATGGSDRAAVFGLAGVTFSSVTASGNQATWTLATPSVFTTAPQVGDTLRIPASSPFVGAGSANAGYWVVTATTNTTTSATIVTVKLNNITAVTVVTAPVNVSTTFSVSPQSDLQIYSPITFTDKSGLNRGSFVSLGSTANCSATASGSTLIFTLGAGAFTTVNGVVRPRAGDTAYIPAGSAIVGGSSANQGHYTVTAVTDTTLTLSRLTNGNPATVASATLSATPDTLDLQIIRPYIDGQQSLLEVYDGGTGGLPLNRGLFNLGTSTVSGALSTALVPAVEVGTDYQAALNIVRSSDGTQENFNTIGGNVALKLSYVGTTASANVSATNIVITVTGGSGANLTLAYSNFPTLTDLVSYVNTQTGYSAAVGNAAAGQLSPTTLDRGTFTIATSTSGGAYPGRIKRDAYDWNQKLLGSAVIDWTPNTNLGLPEYTVAFSLLTNGAKGGTTAASVVAAVDAMENIEPNFIVPLFSQDASADIAAGLTESSSTYTIDGVNAYLKGHVVSLSGQVKRKKNRLGVGSFRGSFTAAKAAAQSLASARYALTFQDVKNVGVSGLIRQYQPWMGAVVAASMQAVGLYRSINHKFANVTGIVSPNADFSPGNLGQLEDALLSGLLTLENPAGGGFRFVSDQTTYGKDDNFVFNSLQVMYTADFMALDLARSFENFAVGQAVSEITAAVGRSFLQAKMSQYFNNKLIAPSDGAAGGYDSDVVTIAGPVMNVSVNAFITNAISFVPINLSISQVSQTA